MRHSACKLHTALTFTVAMPDLTLEMQKPAHKSCRSEGAMGQGLQPQNFPSSALTPLLPSLVKLPYIHLLGNQFLFLYISTYLQTSSSGLLTRAPAYCPAGNELQVRHTA